MPPIIELSRDDLDRIKPNLYDEIKKWKYDVKLFGLARQNIGIYPAITPVIWDLFAGLGRAPLIREIFKEGNFRGADKNTIVARIYQSKTASLRELHLCLKIAEFDSSPSLSIIKDVDKDIRFDIDLIYNNKEIALRHKGKTSDKYMPRRLSKSIGQKHSLFADQKCQIDGKWYELDVVGDSEVKSLVFE